MFEIILAVGLVYLSVALLIRWGLRVNGDDPSPETMPKGSLVICGKDEEGDLPFCLESIERQKLPDDNLEVILVDDASADGTGALMDDFRERSRFAVRVLHLAPLSEGEPGGKWRALKAGIAEAVYPSLLLSDADAILPEKWAQAHLRELQRSDLSAGFVRLSGGGVRDGTMDLDWLFIQAAGAALANLGKPQAALGKNLALRRSVYESVGGLEKVGFSLTEDLALVRAAAKAGCSLRFILSPDRMVLTRGERGWADYLRQRQRWTSGFSRLGWEGKATLLIKAARDIAVILGIVSGLTEAVWIWCATAAADFLILYKICFELDVLRRMRSFLIWEVFSVWSVIALLPLGLFSRKVLWKGRRYSPWR
jgi:cellulose synthase/poly-beta-1,6-N-acetylglucosamine synthase-like glycosyltransferase